MTLFTHAFHFYFFRDSSQGTHEELLALGGKYADMWNMQLHSARGGNKQSTEDLNEMDSKPESATEK